MAGPDGTSGIDPGGTGAGRSLKNCAKAAFGAAKADSRASAKAHAKRAPRPVFGKSWPHAIIVMLFTENAANSSLRTIPYTIPRAGPKSPSARRSVAMQS
jgi:hypothetical protein